LKLTFDSTAAKSGGIAPKMFQKSVKPFLLFQNWPDAR
jgi:hypothetical protein